MRLGRFSGALPLVLMTLLIVAVGAFATVRQDAFLTSFNLNNLLLLTLHSINYDPCVDAVTVFIPVLPWSTVAAASRLLIMIFLRLHSRN